MTMDDYYILTNLEDLSSEIYEPIGNAQRVKYTCMDVSKNYFVFGATSGSVYIFRRNPWKYLQLIPNQFGIINHIGISTNEKFIAYTSVRGNIGIYVVNFAASANVHVLRKRINDAQFTCLQWKHNDEQLYIGDNKGIVYLINLSFLMVSRHLLNFSINPILFLDTAIVQISDYKTFALISNLTKCIICNTETEQFKQIGNHPRSGIYGGCFLPTTSKNSAMAASAALLSSSSSSLLLLPPSSSSEAADDDSSSSSSADASDENNSRTNNFENLRIFCARPKSRLWEVNIEGKVLKTHQFKLKNNSIYSTKIIHKVNSFLNINDTVNKMMLCKKSNDLSSSSIIINDNQQQQQQQQQQDEQQHLDESQILHFGKLTTFLNYYLIGYTSKIFFILDPYKSKVILWNNEYENINTIKLIKNFIIIFTLKNNDCTKTKTNTLSIIKFNRFQDFVIQLLYEEKFILSASIIRENLQYFKERFQIGDIHIIELIKLYNKLKELNELIYLNDLENLFNIINNTNTNGYHKYDINNFDKILLNNESTSSSPSSSSSSASSKPTPTKIFSSNNCTNNKNSSLFSVKNFLLNKLNLFNDTNTTTTTTTLINVVQKKHKEQSSYHNHKKQQEREDEGVKEKTMEKNLKDIQIINQINELLPTQTSPSSPTSQSSPTSPSSTTTIKTLTDEEKILQTLYMIFQSAKISNLNLIERYSTIFDRYNSNDQIIELLKKLQKIMIENGYDRDESKENCYEMYFNYLNPKLISNLNLNLREYIINGFLFINRQSTTTATSTPTTTSTSSIDRNEINKLTNNITAKCDSCSFPLLLLFNDDDVAVNCKFPEIGHAIIEYYWLNDQHEYCFELTKICPYLLYIICKLYYKEISKTEIIPLLFTIGNTKLFETITNDKLYFTIDLWTQAFESMSFIQKYNQFFCIKCNHYITVMNFNHKNEWNDTNNKETEKITNSYSSASSSSLYGRQQRNQQQQSAMNNPFYTWNYLLSILIKNHCNSMTVNDTIDNHNYNDNDDDNDNNIPIALQLIKKYSKFIPSDSIDRNIYLKCLL